MFKILGVVFLTFALSEQTNFFEQGIFSSPEDATLTPFQIISKYGYIGEAHQVQTSDGYILQMHRIAGGSNSPPKRGKKVVFLMHGLGFSSGHWLLFGRNSFAFQLADEGFDVWLGNARGVDYSIGHSTLKPFGSRSDQQKYWSFSWHEIGVYDLPTMIDYILARTEEPKLQFIGHSQATTSYLVMVSEKPQYNDKIEKAHLLAPTAIITNAKTPIARKIAYFIKILQKMNGLVGAHYIPLSVPRTMCRDRRIFRFACTEAVSLMFGRPTDQMQNSMLPIIFGQTAGQAATNQALHYGQVISSGKFRQFDYGKDENLKRYHQAEPPSYSFQNATAPIAVYYSDSDWIATPKDVQTTVSQLPNLIHFYLVPHKAFNHGDFVYGKDSKTLLYDEVVRIMKLTEDTRIEVYANN